MTVTKIVGTLIVILKVLEEVLEYLHVQSGETPDRWHPTLQAHRAELQAELENPGG